MNHYQCETTCIKVSLTSFNRTAANRIYAQRRGTFVSTYTPNAYLTIIESAALLVRAVWLQLGNIQHASMPNLSIFLLSMILNEHFSLLFFKSCQTKLLMQLQGTLPCLNLIYPRLLCVNFMTDMICLFNFLIC